MKILREVFSFSLFKISLHSRFDIGMYNILYNEMMTKFLGMRYSEAKLILYKQKNIESEDREDIFQCHRLKETKIYNDIKFFGWKSEFHGKISRSLRIKIFFFSYN